jgi:hypothetical protein
VLRQKRNSLTSEEAYQKAKKAYQKAIHETMKNSWNTFLTNARGIEIFRAYGYNKQKQLGKLPSLLTAEGQPATSFAKKCNIFYRELFPEPPKTKPINWNESKPSMHYQWPKIKRSEIKYAIYKLSTKKTPGPDRLSFRVLREAYATVPELFNYLYPVLIVNSYHPKCFKKATGVILKKPQSAKSPYRNYTLPKAYKIISLLNYLAKVMKKIIARKLAVMAKFKTLLHMHQIGGRRQKSAINAVIILI